MTLTVTLPCIHRRVALSTVAGVLGYILPPMPLRLLFAIHNHQPVGNFDSVFAAAYERCYRPFVDICGEFPNVQVALHYTGPLLEWIEKNRPDFLKDVNGWLREGRVKYREDITDGLENAPRELIRLLKGENFGKKIIRVSPDPTTAKT